MPLDRIDPRDIIDSMVVAPPPSRSRQLKIVLLTALVLGVLAALFTGYQHVMNGQIAAFMARKPPPTPITAITAEVRTVPRLLTGIGTIQAVRQVTVAPEVGGLITQIFFAPGATVADGDPLVQLNDGPERGDLANYEAMVRVASANLERAKTLSARDFQSRQVVDQQQSLLDQARAEIAKTQAQIAQKLIRAPFAGQLGVRQANLGGYVNPGGAIVTLTDLSSVWINFTLPEQVASQIAIGQDADIKVDAYPGRVFKAKITTIEPQISQQTRNLLVQASLDNPDHALFPGMFANVAVAMPDAPQQVTVPETSVDYSLYGDSVFVVREGAKDGDGKPVLKVERVFVTTGDRRDGRISVLNGLKGGERLAGSGQLRLSNGAEVTILPGDVLATPPNATRY